jgi:hypothetical protein
VSTWSQKGLFSGVFVPVRGGEKVEMSVREERLAGQRGPVRAPLVRRGQAKHGAIHPIDNGSMIHAALPKPHFLNPRASARLT